MRARLGAHDRILNNKHVWAGAVAVEAGADRWANIQWLVFPTSTPPTTDVLPLRETKDGGTLKTKRQR